MNTESLQSSDSRAEASPDDEISLLDVLIVLAGYKKRILAGTFLAAALMAGFSLTLPNIYTASARILPPQQGASGAAALMAQLGGLAGAAGGLAGIKNPGDIYLGMLKSRTLTDAMVARFDLVKYYGVTQPGDARSELMAAATFSAGKDGIIAIDVDAREPEWAATLANGYVDELKKLNQQLAITEASQRRLFFEGHLKSAKERLAAAEVALRELQEKSGLVVLDQQSRASIEAVASLRAQIASREVSLHAMRTFATAQNPDLKMAEQEIAGLRAQLEKIRASEPGDVLIPAAKIPGQGLEFVRRMREMKYAEAMFEALSKQFELARIDEGKNNSLIQVLDSAVPPDYKTKPKRGLLVLIAAVMGCGVMMLSAFLSEALRRARRDPAQAERLNRLRQLVWR
jgi:uncharacterized protein involved in exopolysaccharide biosynthesis